MSIKAVSAPFRVMEKVASLLHYIYFGQKDRTYIVTLKKSDRRVQMN